MNSKQISDNQLLAIQDDTEKTEKVKSNDPLISALGKVRDMFPTPAPGDHLENAWLAAMAFPESVPEYVEQALAQMASAPTLWGYHMRFDNGVKATVEGVKDLLECEAQMDSNEALTRLYVLNGADQISSAHKDSNKCPICESINIDSGRLQADDSIAWATVTCHDCKSEWRNQYVLSGSLVTKKGMVRS